jgi:acyl carrier protein
MIEEIFKGLIASNIIEDMKLDISKYNKVELSSLGVDSLSLMELVLRIEELSNYKFDFDNFDVDSVSTVEKVLKLVNQDEKDKDNEKSINTI